MTVSNPPGVKTIRAVAAPLIIGLRVIERKRQISNEEAGGFIATSLHR
jgi:hypothetical protein